MITLADIGNILIGAYLGQVFITYLEEGRKLKYDGIPFGTIVLIRLLWFLKYSNYEDWRD
jgi:hypothetical protein